MTENDIDHTFNGSNSVDVDADVISVGVRGEYRFDLTEAARLVPYIGLNYLRVSTDGYSTSKGVNVDDIDQNLVTMPVGLKVAASLNTVSGWSWSPSADLAYVAAFGDNDVEAVSRHRYGCNSKYNDGCMGRKCLPHGDWSEGSEG